MAFKITDEDIKRAFSDEPAKKTGGFKVTDADIAKHFKQSDTKTAGAQAPAVSLNIDEEKQTKQKYGLIDNKVVLPSYIENQGLHAAPGTEKSKVNYLMDSAAKGLVGGALQAGEAIWQDLSGDAGKAERAYYDYVMESAYNPQKSGQLAEYQSAKDRAAKAEKLNTNTLGYKLLESSDKDMAKATEGMGRTGQFLTGVVGITLQNAYLIPLAVINPAASAAVMAMSAAGRSAKEQSDRGRSLDRAVARGAVDGSIEYFTELMGMDAVADLLVGQGENIVKNVFRSVVSEAGEEGLSYLAGYIADKLEKDPEAKFSIQELLLNMLAGGLSGGLLGGGSAMVGAMANTMATPEAVTELPAPENITAVNVPASTEFARTNSQENNIDTKPVELPNPANAGISDIIGNEKPFDISKLPQVRPVQLPNPNTAGIVQQAETNEKPFDINSLPQTEKKAVPAVSRLKEYVNTLPEVSGKNAENYLNKKYDDSGITAAQFIENNIDSKFIKDGKLYYIEKDGKRLPVKKSMYDYAMFLQSGAKDINVPGKIDTDTNVSVGENEQMPDNVVTKPTSGQEIILSRWTDDEIKSVEYDSNGNMILDLAFDGFGKKIIVDKNGKWEFVEDQENKTRIKQPKPAENKPVAEETKAPSKTTEYFDSFSKLQRANIEKALSVGEKYNGVPMTRAEFVESKVSADGNADNFVATERKGNIPDSAKRSINNAFLSRNENVVKEKCGRYWVENDRTKQFMANPRSIEARNKAKAAIMENARTTKTEYGYRHKDGTNTVITKTAYDYAKWLGKTDANTNVGAKSAETVNERYSQHQAEKEQGRYVRQNIKFKQTMYNGFAIEKVGDNYIVWDNQTNQIAVTKPTLKGIKEALDKWENSLKNRTATVTETVEENPTIDTAGYGHAKVIGKKGNIDILDSVPDGWKRFDMTTAPVGYVGVTNNKSLFGGERKSALVSEDVFRNNEPTSEKIATTKALSGKTLENSFYTPTYEEIISKPDVKIIDVAIPQTDKMDNDDFDTWEDNLISETKKAPWFNKVLTNKDEDYKTKYGALEGRVASSTIKKNVSYKEIDGRYQRAILQNLDEIFENAVVIHSKPDTKDKKTISKIHTLLSAVRFSDNKIGVIKLNVREYYPQNQTNKIHENKILEIKNDFGLIDGLPSEKMENTISPKSSTISVAELIESVKNTEYYPKQDISENKKTNILPENKTSNVKKEKSTPENKITDFGEKISGARKDMWKDRGLDVRDIEGMTEKEKAKFITKDNIWKKPNYEALIKDGKDKNVTCFLKTVRDALPTKPEFRTTNADLAKQVQEEYVKQMREITDRVMALETKEQIMNAFDEVLVKGGYITKDSSRLYAPWHPTEKGKYIFTEKLFNAFRNAEGTTGWRYLTDKVRKDQFGVPKDEKIPKGYGLREFENGWGVLKGNRIVQDKFATREAALSWLKENTKKAKNNRFVPPSVERVRREGADVRKGEAATGDSFMEKFGFRGGQFGEWTNQKERQMNLNFAYDAFHDLARTLGISEKDVSFGGKLAIAFGARGRGGAKAAAAHYEYTEEVINLTRMKGAGTLGHEWAHALDDFIGQKVVGSVFTKYRGRQSYEPFNKVMDAIKWREATAEELAKMNENSKNDNIRRATSWLNSVFSKSMVEKMTDSQKTKYENLKESFLNAEKGSVDKLNELHKEITNRVIPKSTRDTLMSFEYIWLQTDTNQRTSAKVPTDYIKNSRWFDKYENRSDTYYSSDEEMFARAFHTYILDKTEGVSDYLNGSAEWHVLPDIENNRVVRAYPTGTERAVINKAFDEFFDALKTDGYLTAQEYSDQEMISYSTDGAKVTIEGKMLIEPLKDTDSKPKEKLAKPKKAKDTNKLPESVGAAKANPKNITHLVNEYGEIKPGENPVRFISAPISTNGTDRVGKFARTAMEAEVTSEKMVAAIEKAVARGEFSHEIYRDKTAIKDAIEYIEKYGYEKTLQEFYNRVNNNSGITKQDMTKAMTMYAVAVENNDMKTALKLATKINKAAVNAGQVVQSIRILKKSSPEGRLYYAQKSLEAYQDEVNEKYGDKAPVLKVDDSILTALKDARTEAEIEKATADLHQAIADQLPFSWSNFWTSWRYLAMLGNPRTQVRNVLSNTVNTVATEYTAWIQSVIEKNVKSLPKTTTMEKPTQAQLAFAEKDYENIKKQLTGSGKYRKDSLSAIERLKDPFSFPTFWGKQGDEYVGWRGNVRKAGEPILKGISKWNELTNKAMEQGDLIFSSRAYKRAMARYLKVNNINPAKITAKQLSEARTWATRQALESVFRENNRLASWMTMQERNLANSKKKGDRIAAKIVGGIMPFKGTPLNISKRAFEYTPLGIIKGLAEMKFNDDVYMPAAINDVAKGLSGTSLIVLGAALAKYGLLKGGLGNDKEDKMEKQMGEQAYSISTPWWSYTLDWSGAAMMPLFVGADIYESNSEDENWLTNIINAFANAGSPIIETSMMTGLMDSIQAASYEDKDTEKVMTFLSSAMASYAGQFVPTILGQIARAVDDTSRSSYTNVKGVLKPVAKTLQKAENKIPFLSKTNVPYMDVWGNNEKNIGGNPLGRLAYNMLSPGYISTKSNDKVEKMLVELHEKTGDNSVLPSNYTTYKRIGDETIRFTDKQYEQYTKEYGQTAYSILDDLQSDKGFSSMEDAYRAEIVGKVYKYSTAIASNEVVNKELTARQANQQTAMEKGISAYYVFGGLIEADENSNGSLSKAEVVDYIESRGGLSNTQKAYLFAALGNSNWKNPYA